eukprot:COSAG06_NODE_364_length_16784_cov_21.917231_10_plen_80_part_00
MVSRMGATGRPRSNAVGVCRARASYQRAQQRRRQRAIGLKNAVEGQKDSLFKIYMWPNVHVIHCARLARGATRPAVSLP